MRSPVAERKGGSRPDKVRPITYSARKALLAPSPDNRGPNVGLVSPLCEGVPGSTNKPFTKKENIETHRFLCADVVLEHPQLLPAHITEASYKYWQAYFHGWPWSMMWSTVQVSVSRLMCGSEAPAVSKWLTMETRRKCKAGSFGNESRDFSQCCLSLSFIHPSESLTVFLLHQRIIHHK